MVTSLGLQTPPHRTSMQTRYMNQQFCGQGRPQKYAGMADCFAQVSGGHQAQGPAMPLPSARRVANCAAPKALVLPPSRVLAYLRGVPSCALNRLRACRLCGGRACCRCGEAGCRHGCGWGPTLASRSSSSSGCARWQGWSPSSFNRGTACSRTFTLLFALPAAVPLLVLEWLRKVAGREPIAGIATRSNQSTLDNLCKSFL